MRTRFTLLICFLALAAHAAAWWDEGHMVVAQIAYNHLNARAKAACDSLIATTITRTSSPPERSGTFVTAACWADDVKGADGNWHYIDIPISLDGTTTAGAAQDSFDVVRAIRHSTVVLQSTTATQTDKAESLRYLIHLVGDIHQPLHCCTGVSAAHPDGDRGGNSFPINGSAGNLHALWDSGGGFLADNITRPLQPADQTTINDKVTTAEATYPYTPKIGTIPDPMTWAKEGYNLARTVTYVGITPGSTPSADYLNKVQSICHQRMAVAGYRLADVLNTIFR